MTETRCPLPKMARIRQTFARPRIDDIAAEMREQMQVLTPRIRPGMTVGLTVGSRGIQNILTMLEVAVQAVRGCGASPVLLAAMGSHGGGPGMWIEQGEGGAAQGCAGRVGVVDKQDALAPDFREGKERALEVGDAFGFAQAHLMPGGVLAEQQIGHERHAEGIGRTIFRRL